MIFAIILLAASVPLFIDWLVELFMPAQGAP